MNPFAPPLRIKHECNEELFAPLVYSPAERRAEGHAMSLSITKSAVAIASLTNARSHGDAGRAIPEERLVRSR